MSLILSAVNTFRPRYANEDTLHQPQYRYQSEYFDKSFCGEYQTSPFWPTSSQLGSYGTNVNMVNEYCYNPFIVRPGGTSWNQLSGVTYDGVGTPIASATVDIFNSANDQYIATRTSDAGGYFSIGTPYSANIYCVGHVDSSPIQGLTDIFGTDSGGVWTAT